MQDECGKEEEFGASLLVSERFPDPKGLTPVIGVIWPVFLSYGAFKGLDSQMEQDTRRAAMEGST